MSVKFHVILRNNGQEFRASRSGACFGLLASGNSDDRSGFHIFENREDAPRITSYPAWINNATRFCQFDEIVYEVYEALSRGYQRNPRGFDEEIRMLGGANYTIPIVRSRLRAFLNDINDIKKELPWMSIVSVDLKQMWVKVETDHPADQVFQCLSSIRNIITYDYENYCMLRDQGFSKKASFILAQNFRRYKNAFNESYWKPTGICDYMMVNHAFMRPVDVRRLFNGDITFKQQNLKGSRGYFKPSNYHDDHSYLFNLRATRDLRQFYNYERYEFCENWSTFLSTQNPDEGYVMDEGFRRTYLGDDDGEIITPQVGFELMNRWVQIINRG